MENNQEVNNENIISVDKNTTIKISDDVISVIAGLAAAEVEGISGMTLGFVDGINEMLGKKKFSKGVKVDVTDMDVTIDIYVSVQYGCRIPDVAWDVQNKVKESVENMTGLNVKAVNINVQSVTFEKKDKN